MAQPSERAPRNLGQQNQVNGILRILNKVECI